MILLTFITGLGLGITGTWFIWKIRKMAGKDISIITLGDRKAIVELRWCQRAFSADKVFFVGPKEVPMIFNARRDACLPN